VVWTITSVYAAGSFAGTHPEPFVVPGVNVFVYEDAGSQPGALVASYETVSPTTEPDDLTVPLDPPLSLQAGTYWISIQADLSSLTMQDGWAWAFRTRDVTGDVAVWTNPGDGYGRGAVSWTSLNQLEGRDEDFEFDLRGTAAPA